MLRGMNASGSVAKSLLSTVGQSTVGTILCNGIVTCSCMEYLRNNKHCGLACKSLGKLKSFKEYRKFFLFFDSTGV
jgi:hypothetical protein